MRGWFDAFRSEGGPTLYSNSNRTPVTGDVQTASLALIFATLFIAFLLIFPGVRKERFTTFASVTLSLLVGLAILLARFSSGWHVGSADVHAPYRAFSRHKIHARLGAWIGLTHVNVTLTGVFQGNESSSISSGEVDFNERFHWTAPGEMGQSYRAGLARGLPFPILTVAEYLAFGQEGFAWGAHYRAAGYYACVLLWTAFAAWLAMNVLLAVVPRYGAYAMVVTGCTLLSTVGVYYWLLPTTPLVIHLEGAELRFRLGWAFYAIAIAGCVCVTIGILVAGLDLAYPNRFSTILELDYDTPYDRHMILAKPVIVNRTRAPPPPPLNGIENAAFVDSNLDDVPKSPWRFPAVHRPIRRQVSTSSSITSTGPLPHPLHEPLRRKPALQQEVALW